MGKSVGIGVTVGAPVGVGDGAGESVGATLSVGRCDAVGRGVDGEGLGGSEIVGVTDGAGLGIGESVGAGLGIGDSVGAVSCKSRLRKFPATTALGKKRMVVTATSANFIVLYSLGLLYETVLIQAYGRCVFLATVMGLWVLLRFV